MNNVFKHIAKKVPKQTHFRSHSQAFSLPYTTRINATLLVALILISFGQTRSLLAETQIKTVDNKKIIVRPFAGIGYTDGANLGQGNTGSGTGYHVGLRLMLGANKTQRYGFEYTYLDLYGLESNAPDVRYSALGLIIEQSMFNEQLLLSIGTLGYIGIGDNNDNPFGVRTNIGWEGDEIVGLRPFAVWRGDYIFDRETIVIYSISLGLRKEF